MHRALLSILIYKDLQQHEAQTLIIIFPEDSGSVLMDPNKPSLFSSAFSIFAKGFLMGGADIIPGVSGGTMALIVGIYERLVNAIDHVYKLIILAFRLRFDEAKEAFNNIDWELLIPLAIGIGSAIFLLAHLINYLLTNYPIECRGLFFGLIAASVSIPWMRAKDRGPAKLGIAAITCIAAFFSAGLASPGNTKSKHAAKYLAQPQLQYAL